MRPKRLDAEIGRVRLVVTEVVTDCCAGDAKLDIGVEVDMGATGYAPSLTWEPVSGFEPLACRLQEVRPPAPRTLAAWMTRLITLTALVALGLSGAPFHEPFHADGRQRSMTVAKRSDRNPVAGLTVAASLALARPGSPARAPRGTPSRACVGTPLTANWYLYLYAGPSCLSRARHAVRAPLLAMPPC